MRNLKKILALVLALVMSLSLMATASAASFPDVADDSYYKVATDILNGLKVFKGYEDGTFRPENDITRAEVAAIIYRIATADVGDTQEKIYSTWNMFDDVVDGDWYAGYVNYCANAEIVVGNGNRTFTPRDKVTGYAVLAMILRAMGYDKNHEFQGPDWQIQTAATAKQEGLLNGVDNTSDARLGQPATRGMVAQILCNALLTETVSYTVQYGYQHNGKTLGAEKFGLEKIEGVVMANQWASLSGDAVKAEGVTDLKITDNSDNVDVVSEIGKTVTLDWAEEDYLDGLNAVGLRHAAYLADDKDTGNKKVLTMTSEGYNNVAYNEGKAVNHVGKGTNAAKGNEEWDSVGALAKTAGIDASTVNTTAAHFLNYGPVDESTQKYSQSRIAYAITKEGLPAAWTAYFTYLKANPNATSYKDANGVTYSVAGHSLEERTIWIDGYKDGKLDGKRAEDNSEDVDCWFVAIRPEKIINKLDLDIMEEIFASADRLGANNVMTTDGVVSVLQNYAVGEVYVGTTSMKDYSDDMSWYEFKEEYLKDDTNTNYITYCNIGDSLRVIDWNKDGKADYVLKIAYTQDKVVGTYKGDLLCNSVALANYPEGNTRFSPNADDISQGTVVNYVVIDGKLYIWKAAIETDKIDTKNFTNVTVTTASGDPYGQSGIANRTGLEQDIMLMNNNTDYNMYLDQYGYIRSYELAQSSKYALLTEMYPTTDRNSNYIRDFRAIAEAKLSDAELQEYPVANNSVGGGTAFFSPYIWTYGARSYTGAGAWWNTGDTPVQTLTADANYLQPAVAHLYEYDAASANAPRLGITNNQVDWNGTADRAWVRWVAEMRTDAPVTKGTGSAYGVFDYETAPSHTHNPDPTALYESFSYTNVAAYVENDGALTLNTASKLAKSTANGLQLYRVSTAAATHTTATTADPNLTNMSKLYGFGTMADLIAAYDSYVELTKTYVKDSAGDDLTTGLAWFNEFVSNTYRDGTGIYPIYAEDYIQLDLTKECRDGVNHTAVLPTTTLVVKPGIRHYHIDENYNTLYNTNSNVYVDATVDTEFYIVQPGTAKDILYRLGYDELPRIQAEDIRAAYAVAHNTSTDNANQDYWVADVIVIETKELDYDYDSIALNYWNDSETNNSIRNADILDNEWRTLQPTYDGQAMMRMVPTRSQIGLSGVLDWGNVPWSSSLNYGFYKLYQTEWSEPNNLKVTTANRITEDYNRWGIYAGTVTRVADLTNSKYMDVSTWNTGFVQTQAINMHYGETNEVPVYRITGSYGIGYGFVASTVIVNPVDQYSELKVGDRIIWVYNKAQTELSFVVVVEPSLSNVATGARNNDLAPWMSTLYGLIITDQENNGSSAADPATLLANAKKMVDKFAATPATAADLPALLAMIEQLQELLDDYNNGDVSLNGTQKSNLDSYLAALQADALSLAKAAAIAAARAEGKKATDNPNLALSAGAAAAIDALVKALTDEIDAKSTLDDVLKYYKDGKLVTGANAEAKVTALVDGVAAANELADAKAAAIAAVDAKVKAAGVDISKLAADDPVKTAYTTLVDKIKACEDVSGNADSSKDVETYYKNNVLSPTETAALTSALNAAASDAAKAAAAAKAEELAGVNNNNRDIAAVKAALATLNGLIATASDEDLAALAAGDVESIKNSDLYNACKALERAVKDSADEEKKNEDAEKEVQPGETGSDPETGVSYDAAYAAAGFTFNGSTGTKISIQGKKSDFSAFIQNAGEDPLIAKYIEVMTSTDPGHAGEMLVGGSFTAPADAKSVKYVIGGSRPADWSGENVKTVTRTDNSKHSKFDEGGVHFYVTVANNSNSADPDSGFWTAVTTGESATIWMQFFDDNGSVSGIIECTIELTWS